MACYNLQYCKSESLLDSEINIALLFSGFLSMHSCHDKGATDILYFLKLFLTCLLDLWYLRWVGAKINNIVIDLLAYS